jgi:hypothetical protein
MMKCEEKWRDMIRKDENEVEINLDEEQSVEVAVGYKKTKNAGALVRQRTVLTERPPLVGEVSANFSG